MKDGLRIGATIEARMTSSRLPGKVLMEAAGKPMLELMVERLRRVPTLDQIVIATTTNAQDDPIQVLAERLGVGCFRGSEEDVLGRVLGAARAYELDVIVETTGDCPLIDPAISERVIQTYLQAGVDYVSNILEITYPIGMDTQVFAVDVLAEVARLTQDPLYREHVSLYIYRHPQRFSLLNVAAPAELHDPDLHITLDTAEDYALISALVERLYPQDPAFDLAAILELVRHDPELRRLNAQVVRKSV